MLVASAWWVDAVTAVAAGIVATALWTFITLRQQRRQLRDALDAFLGSYRVHDKSTGNPDAGTVQISHDGRRLEIEWPDNSQGPVTGHIVLSDRFPESGWGTWDVEAVVLGEVVLVRAAAGTSGHVILVTTRFPLGDVEIVQGDEWRRLDFEEGAASQR